jgi:hypothetical protein
MSSNSTINSFLSNENVQMLWEVIIDDPTVAQNTTTQQLFTQVIPEFYEREKTKYKGLMEMNKQFISIIVDLLHNSQQQSKIATSTIKEKITFEELHQERVSQFEQALNARQEEFSQAMTVPLPPVPNFADGKLDTPLTEMERIIQQTIAERNLEMEKIQKKMNMNKTKDGESWLQGQSTSIKEQNDKDKNAALQSTYAPKTIKIGKELKEVSWGSTTQIEPLEYNPVIQDTTQITNNANTNANTNTTLNIFSKLKVKDPLKDLEELINKRFDKLEEMIISISKKE